MMTMFLLPLRLPAYTVSLFPMTRLSVEVVKVKSLMRLNL